MCGIAGIFGSNGDECSALTAMVRSQTHRGPDHEGIWIDPGGSAALGQNRLSILDLSSAGWQPMWNSSHTAVVVFNGEIYNYLELRKELAEYPYRSQTDTEVILAAWERWGMACLDRFEGMFAFLLWDCRKQELFAARDRFGVKPLYYCECRDGTLLLASEIKALQAAGEGNEPDCTTWATYLSTGLSDHGERTFWRNVRAVPAGHSLVWRDYRTATRCWYNLAERVGPEYDSRAAADVEEEYRELLLKSVRFRFRSDVPVGINLSGGLDSSLLLGLVHAVQGASSDVRAFTFTTGDPEYDELPWVAQMLNRTHHPHTVCQLGAEEVPGLAERIQQYQDEPFGGLPTLAYSKVFESAREHDVLVLLDGQGMDEQWCGYDYYERLIGNGSAGLVQGTVDRSVRPECLTPEFAALCEHWQCPTPFSDRIRNIQFRDVTCSKIPRALRFNDRISMRWSTELREPFLDHSLVELAFRQPPRRKIDAGIRKVLLRRIAATLLPDDVGQAPKRPVQTPQREWLRGPLRPWAERLIEAALAKDGTSWFQPGTVREEWQRYLRGESDNSHYVWQWLSCSLMRNTSISAV